MAGVPRPTVTGIHHIKLASSNLEKTHDFYTNVLGFTAIPQLTHRHENGQLYAFLMKAPGNTMVEVRDHAEQAKLQKGWDPVTWAVTGKQDLEDWGKWFDEKGVHHSRTLKGVQGWLMAAEDPDGKRVRLYTLETHEWTAETDKDAYWLS